MIDYALPTGLSGEELEKAIREEEARCATLTDWPDVDEIED